jgi:hypothetical protein
MEGLFDILIRFFNEDDWDPSQIDQDPVLQMKFNGDNGHWICYAQAREEQEQFVFYSMCPVKVPETHRLAMAEFLTRANYKLVIGNFEMDLKDGEIRFKTSIDIEGTELNDALIKGVVYINVLTMDRYLPGIMAVASGSASPVQAIEQVEAS